MRKITHSEKFIVSHHLGCDAYTMVTRFLEDFLLMANVCIKTSIKVIRKLGLVSIHMLWKQNIAK